MSDVFTLYISAAPDLRGEREVLGRAVTEVPTTLGWKVRQTPGPGKEPDYAALARADLHVVLLGADIQAPVGLEWLTARRAGREPKLFIKTSVAHTQAADAFARELARHGRWDTFGDAAALRRTVLRLIVDRLLSHATEYALAHEEAERLRDWRKRLDAPDSHKVDDVLGGANDGAVIMSAERFTPSHGTLITASQRGG